MNFFSYIIFVYIACWFLVPGAIGLTAVRWWASEPKFELPKWRSCLALAAFSLALLSDLLWFWLVIMAFAKGGFRFYDSFLLGCYGIGFLLGLCGFLISLPAKGKLRWP